MPLNPSCPGCDGPLVEVPRHSKWLNDDQYDAQKAGDWYCETCPDNSRGLQRLCYWSDSEVEAHERVRCAAVCHI